MENVALEKIAALNLAQDQVRMVFCMYPYMATEYTSVKVPKVLADKISNVAIRKGTYRSVSEFMLDSARRHLEAIEK